MVRAAVAERELVRLAPGREREQLVAEADPEDRDASDQAARIVACSSVSGSGSPGPFESRTPS